MWLIIPAQHIEQRITRDSWVPSEDFTSISHVIHVHVIVIGDRQFPGAHIPTGPDVTIETRAGNAFLGITGIGIEFQNTDSVASHTARPGRIGDENSAVERAGRVAID